MHSNIILLEINEIATSSDIVISLCHISNIQDTIDYNLKYMSLINIFLKFMV